MFKSIPDEQKTLFVGELLASLDESDREKVLSRFRGDSRPITIEAQQVANPPDQEPLDPDKELERLIRLQEFSFEQDRGSMKSQMLGCLLWAFAALAAVVGIGFVIGKAWQWLNAL